MAYITALADALRYATSLGTLTATTTPTSTIAALHHTDAFADVRSALVLAELSPETADVTGLLLANAQLCEALLTSGNTLLAKESLGEAAVISANRLLKRARDKLAGLRKSRAVWLTQGGVAATVASGWASSHFTDDRDSTINQTPGTGDIPFAAEVDFESTARD